MRVTDDARRAEGCRGHIGSGPRSRPSPRCKHVARAFPSPGPPATAVIVTAALAPDRTARLCFPKGRTRLERRGGTDLCHRQRSEWRCFYSFYKEGSPEGWGQRHHRRREDGATSAKDTPRIHTGGDPGPAFPIRKIRTRPDRADASLPGGPGRTSRCLGLQPISVPRRDLHLPPELLTPVRSPPLPVFLWRLVEAGSRWAPGPVCIAGCADVLLPDPAMSPPHPSPSPHSRAQTLPWTSGRAWPTWSREWTRVPTGEGLPSVTCANRHAARGLRSPEPPRGPRRQANRSWPGSKSSREAA